MTAPAPEDAAVAAWEAHPAVVLHRLKCRCSAQSAILQSLVGIVAETDRHWDALLLKILARALDQIEQAEHDPGEQSATKIEAADIIGRARAALLTNEAAPSVSIN